MGDETVNFLSTSQLIQINADDFIWPELTVDGDKFTFYVKSMFVDSVKCDSEYMHRFLVANGLKNKKWRFKLTTKGDATFSLDAIAVFKPLLTYEE